jgi:hypothetical protein
VRLSLERLANIAPGKPKVKHFFQDFSTFFTGPTSCGFVPNDTTIRRFSIRRRPLPSRPLLSCIPAADEALLKKRTASAETILFSVFSW